MQLTPELKAEYVRLYKSLKVNHTQRYSLTNLVTKMRAFRERYVAITEPLGLPWGLLAVIHYMECGMDFDRHLHNGDPLSNRTTRVPAGRPTCHHGPFTFEESATDALQYRGFDKVSEWTISRILFELEAYNGWGYRKYHPETLSPYLWGGTNHYQKGKYVADGKWSEVAVSKQLGAAAILTKLLSEETKQTPRETSKPPITFQFSKATEEGQKLQQWLNSFDGIELATDGITGRNTSDAFMKVTGRYLHGDPKHARAGQ